MKSYHLISLKQSSKVIKISEDWILDFYVPPEFSLILTVKQE